VPVFSSTCAVSSSPAVSAGRENKKFHRLAGGVVPDDAGHVQRVKVRYHRRGESFLEEKAQIFMANHQSDYDIFVVLGYIPSQFRAGSPTKELFKIPVFGLGYAQTPVTSRCDASSTKRPLRSIDEAAEKIREGKSVMSFPEGGTAAGDIDAKPCASRGRSTAGHPVGPRPDHPHLLWSCTGRVMQKRSLQINPGNFIMVNRQVPL
jgi:1-acyl-sn-glycerol-3-phosphate acyltransferase